MEEGVPLTKQELTLRLVQELAKKGDEIPEIYLRKDGFPEAIDAPDLWKENLLIDVSLLSSAPELEKLRSALSQWGCFLAINHGIESSFLEELIEVTKQFFALPLEEKLKCTAADDIVQGYGSDAVYSGTETLNWNDRLFLSLYPKERVRPQCWPQKPEKLREMINEYSKKITEVNKVICKAMARSLNLEENSLNIGKQGPAIARFNFYPRCPCPERILGTRPHSDGAAITYVLPEKGVGGLQILKDDQWYNVSVLPGALFVNFSDLGEVLTNGVFKSVVHRVGTNSAKDRVSVAMFLNPDEEDQIGPLRGLVSAHQPQVYKKFNLKLYWREVFESFRRGSRALDAFQI